jgi:hypothetical protein
LTVRGWKKVNFKRNRYKDETGEKYFREMYRAIVTPINVVEAFESSSHAFNKNGKLLMIFFSSRCTFWQESVNQNPSKAAQSIKEGEVHQ